MSDEASPRPWTWAINDDDQLMLYDADGNPLGQLFDHGCEPEANLIVDAVNNADSWRSAYIAARTERNAFLLERDRLRDLVKRMTDKLEVHRGIFTASNVWSETGCHETCSLIREARAAIGEDKE